MICNIVTIKFRKHSVIQDNNDLKEIVWFLFSGFMMAEDIDDGMNKKNKRGTLLHLPDN